MHLRKSKERKREGFDFEQMLGVYCELNNATKLNDWL